MKHQQERMRTFDKWIAASFAFTLVELLVVIAVIAILASLLLPALKKARGTAIQTSCAGQIKILGPAFHMYTDDYNGLFPPGYYGSMAVGAWRKDWMQILAPYLNLDLGEGQFGFMATPKNFFLQCPLVKDFSVTYLACSYGYNLNALGFGSCAAFGLTRDFPAKPTMITQPSDQLLNAESWYHPTFRIRGRAYLDDQAYLCFRHFRMANTLYLDGHVKPEKEDWLWRGHASAYPWNYLMLNRAFFYYPGRVSWAAQYGYEPYQ